MKRGDIFVLGGQTYEFLYAQGLTVFVKSSHGRMPTVPSWFSDMLHLSFELAQDIGTFRRHMHEHYETKASLEDTQRFVQDYLYSNKDSAHEINTYCKEQYDYAKIPHDRRIIIEHYTDRNKRIYVFHTLYGRRVNDVLSRAVAFVASKMTKTDCELGINDQGFYLASIKPIQAKRAFTLVKKQQLREIVELSLEKTEVLGRRFRHCAARALMILRQYKGNRKSVGRQQMSSRMLISAVKRIDPNFPILKEARREVLEDLMDIGKAELILEKLESGEIALDEIYTDFPSPFAVNIIAQGYSDILKMEDKYEFLQRMHNMVLLKIDLKKNRKNE
jgi:ATP-dependent Lhr-like helicase